MEQDNITREELLRQVDALERELRQLEDNLIHDSLTGLKTRAFFEEEVGLYLEIISQNEEKGGASSRRQRFGFRNLSIIFFDIDYFKKVNDTHGHDAGDVVLKQVAETIRASLRTGDTAARWGGEEMLASLLGATEADAAAKAEEIRSKVESLSFPEVPGLKITISAGVASSEKGVGIKELINRSDKALYVAKEGGRNRVVPYSALHGNQG